LEQLQAIAKCNNLCIEKEDYLLHFLLQWSIKNKGTMTSLIPLIEWQLISEEHLIYLYQNRGNIEEELFWSVKEELVKRNILNENFEAMLQEKEQEINDLKGQLEKYKMSEKLATSILESPYTYSSNTQALRRKKKEASYFSNSFASHPEETPSSSLSFHNYAVNAD